MAGVGYTICVYGVAGVWGIICVYFVGNVYDVSTSVSVKVLVLCIDMSYVKWLEIEFRLVVRGLFEGPYVFSYGFHCVLEI